MDHKYKALLQNIPTRHVITAIAAEADRPKQIENLRNLDINNFFVLGTFASIKGVLDAAKSEFFERNFAWHVITQSDGESVDCNCINATVMFVKPMADPSTKDRLGQLKTSYNMKKEPIITTAFYFDLALRAFTAVK